MKTSFQFFFALLIVIAFCGGCSREGCTDPSATNYNSKATKGDGSCRYVCNATNYTGSGSCGSGYVVVGGGYCCPASKPYTCASATSCYATCEDAKAAGCSSVEKGISQTGGGGGNSGYVCSGSSCSYVSSGASYTSLSSCQSSCGGSGSCSSTNYTGAANCGSGYVGVGGYCCPNGSPYYCSATNLCYTTCQNAKSAGCSTPIKGIYQTNGGGSAGYNCNSGTCSYVSSGASYASLSSCQSSCGGSSAGYVCSGGSCSYVSSGSSYTSLSSCQSSCGGGSSQVVFYTTKSTYGQINIFVNNSQRGTITQYYSATPSCGASGCVTVTITNQNNTWYAENTAGTYTWTGSFQLSSGCNTVQLN